MGKMKGEDRLERQRQLFEIESTLSCSSGNRSDPVDSSFRRRYGALKYNRNDTAFHRLQQAH
jgi:hypothetical protein